MSVAMAADPAHHHHPTPQLAMSPAGRLREAGLSDTDRNMAVATHLSPFLGFLVFGPLALAIPLMLWLIRKSESEFMDDHGREVINFCISFVLLHVVLVMTVVGVIGIPVLWIVGIVNVIRGSMAAGNSEYFRYPMTIRFLS